MALSGVEEWFCVALINVAQQVNLFIDVSLYHLHILLIELPSGLQYNINKVSVRVHKYLESETILRDY